MKLVIELGNKEDMTKGILLLQAQLGVDQGVVGPTPVQKQDSMDDMLGGDDLLSGTTEVGGDDGDMLLGGSGSDDLDSLMGGTPAPPKPPVVTVEDMKQAIRAAIDATDKEKTNAVIQKALAKLGVDALSKIPDEKKAGFVAVLKAFASKKQ